MILSRKHTTFRRALHQLGAMWCPLLCAMELWAHQRMMCMSASAHWPSATGMFAGCTQLMAYLKPVYRYTYSIVIFGYEHDIYIYLFIAG